MASPFGDAVPLLFDFELSCVVRSICFLTSIPCFATGLVLRMVLFYNKLDFNHKVAYRVQERMKGGILDDDAIKELKDAKFYASEKFGNWLAVLTLSITFSYAGIITVFICPQDYERDCQGTLTALRVAVAGSLFLVVLPYGIYFRLRKRAFGEPDPFFILHEIEKSLQVVTPVAVVAIVYTLISPDPRPNFSPSVFLDLCLLIVFIRTCPYQIYLSYNNWQTLQQKDNLGFDVTLTDILHNEDGLTLFEQHLVSEFSVENLTLWKVINRWKDKYDATEEEVRKREANNIYMRWLAPGALVQVNLPGALVIEIADELNKPSIKISKTVFDLAQFEVFNLMSRDSFQRFRLTPLFKEYLGINEDNSDVATEALTHNI